MFIAAVDETVVRRKVVFAADEVRHRLIKKVILLKMLD
jgi:hypothetical protein